MMQALALAENRLKLFHKRKIVCKPIFVQEEEHADLRISMPEMQGTLLCGPVNVRA
jgi:hypothetical protein